MQFTHKQQIEYLESLKREAGSPLERTMLHDILISVLDSKSHRVIVGGMVHCTMNYARYKKYMVDVVTPERDQILTTANEAIIEPDFEINSLPRH